MQAKHINRYIKIFFLASVILTYSCKKNEIKIDCIEYAKPQDTYIYPVLPGTSAWLNLKPEQRLPACQIPDNILSTLSAESLIQSWIDFPLNVEIRLANSLQKGIEFFVQNFSGLSELTKRNDAGTKLLERYQKMNPACVVNQKTLGEKGHFTFNFTYIEMVIAQDTILRKLNSKQKKQLVSEALNKYNDKKKLVEFYGSFGVGNTLFVCIKTMKEANYTPFLHELESEHSFFLNYFIQDGNIPTNNLNAVEIKVILNHAVNFIK